MDVLQKNNVTIKGNVSAPRTIIFAHGFGTDQTAWTKVSAAFENDYKIVLYDNIGGGNSDVSYFSPNRYNSLEPYASDLIDICKALSLQDAILVAHSVSAMIGILAVNRMPGLFSKLILVGGSSRYLNDVGYTGGFAQEDLDQIYDAMATNYYAWVSGFASYAMANPDRPLLAENFAGSLSRIRPDIAQSVVKVIFQSDYRNELPKIKLPSLLIQAKNDPAVPLPAAEYLQQHIKGSKLVVVNATGHFPHISAPDEVISETKSFISAN